MPEDSVKIPGLIDSWKLELQKYGLIAGIIITALFGWWPAALILTALWAVCYTLDQEPNQPIGFLQMIVPPISDRVVVALAVAAAIFGNRWHK